jgi:glycosyltransferase involved in cell wall biosynthesis
VQYEKNQGKGHALRLGFKKAVEYGYDYAITIDSDGQHFAEDLPKFIEKLKQHPQAIIMGARNMDQASVPGKSSFGHKFSNFWFKVETGVQMSDTQSGYRLYPVKLLQNFKFMTKKFEFEIEVMVRAVWSGIEITEVPVRVFYAEKGERISHFRPFKDFTRISILNTVLVTLALLYYKPRDLYRSIKKKTSGK